MTENINPGYYVHDAMSGVYYVPENLADAQYSDDGNIEPAYFSDGTPSDSFATKALTEGVT